MDLFNRLKAFVVRLFLALHFTLVVWRVTVSWNDHYWLLGTAIVPFLLEGLYTIIKRKGLEWRQFSLCFFFYLLATLPGIWLLEIKKTNTYQSQNVTQVEDIVVSGVEIPIRLSPNTWVLVAEEMMLYLMILGRWLLPRGGVGREQLTQLLFGFVGIASDIMELFSLFDEDPGVRHNDVMTYCILSVWSLSIFQFTLSFATAHRPRRARGLRTSIAESPPTDHARRHRVSVLRVELLATVLSMLMQDGPFLVLRMYTIVTFNVITYSLVFFTAKNVLVILLLNYKVFLLLGKLCCPKDRGDDLDDEDEEEEDEEGYGGGVVEKDGVIVGPYVRGPGVKGVTPGQHINGRAMHPMSTMPQFVVMRNRRHDGEVKLNPLYAGHDKYGRQYIGDPYRNNVRPNGVFNPQRNYARRNVVNLQREYVDQNIGEPQRNRVSWNIEEPQARPRGTEPVSEGNEFLGDLQRAVEGPATPATKVVRGLKSSRRVKSDDSPKENGADGELKPDIAVISTNDLIGDQTAGVQDDMHGNGNTVTNDPDSKENATDDSRYVAGDGGSGENQPSASGGPNHQLPPEFPSEGDFSFLADFDDDHALAEGKLPTNGAFNALALSTMEWEEDGEGQAAASSADTGGQGGHNAKITSRDSMAAIDIKL